MLCEMLSVSLRRSCIVLPGMRPTHTNNSSKSGDLQDIRPQ